MKRKFIAMLLICAAVFLSVVFVALPKSASAGILFQLVNKSGRTFKEIWVGPASNGRWLDRDRFRNSNGTSVRLKSGYYLDLEPNMNGRSDVQYWDIKVVTTDGKKHEWYNIDLFNIYQVEIDSSYTAHFAR